MGQLINILKLFLRKLRKNKVMVEYPRHLQIPNTLIWSSPLWEWSLKKAQGQFRLIHDLSYPENNSVNSQIPAVNSQVSYDSIDTVINLVKQFGSGALMAKCDFQDGFRNIPIHPDDYHLLGFMWDNLYYYDKCLPMGASSSCQIFEKLSSSLQWIMLTNFLAKSCLT